MGARREQPAARRPVRGGTRGSGRDRAAGLPCLAPSPRPLSRHPRATRSPWPEVSRVAEEPLGHRLRLPKCKKRGGQERDRREHVVGDARAACSGCAGRRGGGGATPTCGGGAKSGAYAQGLSGRHSLGREDAAGADFGDGAILENQHRTGRGRMQRGVKLRAPVAPRTVTRTSRGKKILPPATHNSIQAFSAPPSPPAPEGAIGHIGGRS